jgi:hypothetical protein
MFQLKNRPEMPSFSPGWRTWGNRRSDVLVMEKPPQQHSKATPEVPLLMTCPQFWEVEIRQKK